MELEEEEVLGGERLQQGEKGLVQPGPGAGALAVLQPGLDPAIHWHPMQLFVADPVPPGPLGKPGGKLLELSAAEGDPVLGLQPMDRLAERQTVADQQLLQENRIVSLS